MAITTFVLPIAYNFFSENKKSIIMNSELKSDYILATSTTDHFVNGKSLSFESSRVVYPNPSEYGKTMFLVYNGALRQFRIKHCIVFPFNYGIGISQYGGGIYHNITTIEVAGIGELYIGNYMYGGEFDFKVYESFEDYQNGTEYKMKYLRVSMDVCAKRFGIDFKHESCMSRNEIRRWYWNGTCAELREINEMMPICYQVDKNGVSFHDGWSKNQLDGYSTKEECIADNEINVCCFDESDEPKPFTIKAEATFSRVIKVVAKNHDEAVEKAKKELSNNSFNENDNSGTKFS